LNLWALIPLCSSVAYAILLVTTTLEIKKRVNKYFAFFLFASLCWSVASFLLTYNPSTPRNHLIIYNNLVLICVVWSIVSYHHFIRVFTNRNTGVVTYLGYSAVLIMAVLAIFGYVVQDAVLSHGYLYQDLGPWVYVLIAILMPIIIVTMVLLIKRVRASHDKNERNTLKYMIAGLTIVGVWGPLNSNIRALSGLPTDHLGTMLNAVIIGFTISNSQLLDFGKFARKFLTYTILAVCAAGVYVAIIMLEVKALSYFSPYEVVITTVMISVVFSLLFRPLSPIIQRQVDRLFHQNDIVNNKLLADFSSRTANIIELERISNDLLGTLSKNLKLTCADLLFPEVGTGSYVTYETYPKEKCAAGDVLKFNCDSTVVVWLAKEGKPLDITALANIPEVKAIFPVEKSALVDPRLSLLVPIIRNEKMIGILALGHRQGGDTYREEHLHLITALTQQAGVVIENAQLYAIARDRANIDELTSLFNHRYFHQRLDEEIARSSRFGDVFSLLIIDLDFFKSYNDINGHLYGDKVLKRVGEILKKNIRNIDMAFRYGGDEFAVILPQTAADGALKLSDRIRHSLEEYDDQVGMMITCSIGIATWPTGGVMHEEIIQTADNALYFAKENGRNRVIDASQMGPLQNKSTYTNGNAMILSTIYALAATVDAKDHYTYGHSKKVSKYATDIAVALGLSEERIATIRTAGLLHDIGKIGVSDQILSKTGGLSEEEWDTIHAHPTMGVSIIKHVESIKDCLAAVQYHHERYDGQGYPTGLKGNNIPMDARILAIADSYDAMTSARPYKDPMTQDEAMKEIIRCSGTQFDPDIVKVFAKVMSLNNNNATALFKT
jgi:diguanylate cyclase (GGDEF)-like protein/putative nucleotidyltransferase with HDIG domain